MKTALLFFDGTNVMLQAPDGKAAIRVENIKHGPSAEAGMVMIFLPNHTPIARVGQTYELPSGYTYEVRTQCACHRLKGPSPECLDAGKNSKKPTPYACAKPEETFATIKTLQPEESEDFSSELKRLAERDSKAYTDSDFDYEWRLNRFVDAIIPILKSKYTIQRKP